MVNWLTGSVGGITQKQAQLYRLLVHRVYNALFFLCRRLFALRFDGFIFLQSPHQEGKTV